MTDRIGVGIVGANPDRGWALRAHIPALASLPQFELRAISTSRAETAQAAAKKFNVALAFDNAAELAAHPGVDIVAICVKVPRHLELVRTAINAGKAVYCEWPLGNGLAEAIEMAELARKRSVKTQVGLQARVSAPVNYIRDLVAQGYVGKVLSTSVIASGMAYAETVEAANAYLLDKRNGANIFTIPFGHFTDAMCYALGEFETLTGTLATVRPSVKVAETGEILPITSPDQVAVTGVLQGGAAASLHFRAGRSRGNNLLWEINGSDGDLVITGGSGHIQYMEVTIKGGRGKDQDLSPLTVPESYRTAPAATPSGPALNVAQAYLQLASDMSNGTDLATTFGRAVVRHRMIEAIQASSDKGIRQSYNYRGQG
jgi:predicted dehydrogenase